MGVSEGPLDRPVFGTPPPVLTPQRRMGQAKRYWKILDMVKEHPGQWQKIAHFNKGGKEGVVHTCRAHLVQLRKHFIQDVGLEDWEAISAKTPDTWADREIWVIYRGMFATEEERDRTMAERKSQLVNARRKGIFRREEIQNASAIAHLRQYVK